MNVIVSVGNLNDNSPVFNKTNITEKVPEVRVLLKCFHNKGEITDQIIPIQMGSKLGKRKVIYKHVGNLFSREN